MMSKQKQEEQKQIAIAPEVRRSIRHLTKVTSFLMIAMFVGLGFCVYMVSRKLSTTPAEVKKTLNDRLRTTPNEVIKEVRALRVEVLELREDVRKLQKSRDP